MSWFQSLYASQSHLRDVEWIEEEEARQLHEVRDRLDRVRALMDDIRKRQIEHEHQVPHDRRQ